MNENIKWSFNAKLGIDTINNLGNFLKKNDIDINQANVQIAYSITPSLSNDGVSGMMVNIEKAIITIDYDFFEEGQIKNGILTLDTTKKQIEYNFNTRELKFESDGSFSINYCELYFGKNDLQIDLG